MLHLLDSSFRLVPFFGPQPLSGAATGMAPPRRITTVQLLAAWLLFLAVFDAVAFARLLTEPLASVSPIFLAGAPSSAALDGSFKKLFGAFLALLVIVRVSAAFDIRNLTAWRITAIVHVIEAGYFAQAAFLSPEGVFGPRGPRKPPATAVLVFASIVLNAVIFTCWWFWLRVRERRELAAAAASGNAGGGSAGGGSSGGAAGAAGGKSLASPTASEQAACASASAAAQAHAQAQAQAHANQHLESEDEDAHEEDREADDSDNAEDDETDEDFDPATAAADAAAASGAGAVRLR